MTPRPPISPLFPYTTLFRSEPAERAKAMGVIGFVAAGGGSIGVLLGGVLTDLLSWHWIFLRSEEHTSELQSHSDIVCRLLLEKKTMALVIPFGDSVHKS